MLRPAILLFMLLLSCGWLDTAAQEVRRDMGTVAVYQDSLVEELVAKQIVLNETVTPDEGYRIQIFMDSGANSKSRALAAMDEFMAKNLGLRAYLAFKAPNYKVKIGDFRSRLDAIRCLNQIAADYPNAFIISDQISLPQLEP